MLTVVLCATAQPQTKDRTPSPKAPELKLRIVPNKNTYVLHEIVFTHVEFTNLTDKTLCFPELGPDAEVPTSGYLTIEGDSPDGQERDRFIEVFDGGGVAGREKLLSEIEKNWIKVAPNAAYITKATDSKVDLLAAGKWRLRAVYHPPEGSFNPAGYREFLQSTAQTVGCTVPEKFVSAEPVAINVIPPPDQK